VLNIHQVSENPFGYRVTGEPSVNDKRVEVTFRRSVHRASSGPILGASMTYATGEGTGVFKEEARWLTERAVIVESY
jgi:hypothetical protein